MDKLEQAIELYNYGISWTAFFNGTSREFLESALGNAAEAHELLTPKLKNYCRDLIISCLNAL